MLILDACHLKDIVTKFRSESSLNYSDSLVCALFDSPHQTSIIKSN